MGMYGNYGFDHYNNNKNRNLNNKNNTNKDNHDIIRENERKRLISNILVVFLVAAIIIGMISFIVFTDNEIGRNIRETFGIEFSLLKNKEYESSYKEFLESADVDFREIDTDEPYYADHSFIEKQQEIIDSGNIPTRVPDEKTNDMDIVTVDDNGHVKVDVVQGTYNPTATPKATPVPTIVATNPTTAPTIAPTALPTKAPTQPIVTQAPNVTPIYDTVTPIVTQVVTPAPTIPQQVTPIPNVVTPIPNVVTPIPATTTPIPPTQTESYTLNQNAYNNAETTAQNYSDVTSALLTEINAVRQNNGLSALTIDATLNKMAGYRAYDMAENKYFSHSYNGVSQLRVVMYAYNRLSIRHYENLGQAKNVAQDGLAKKVVQGWCESPGHYGVLTNANLSTIGLACSYADKTWYIATIYSN